MNDLRAAVRDYLWSDDTTRRDALAALMQAYDESGGAVLVTEEKQIKDAMLATKRITFDWDEWAAAILRHLREPKP